MSDQPDRAEPNVSTPPRTLGASRAARRAPAALLALACLVPPAALAGSLRLSAGLPFSDVDGTSVTRPLVSADGRFAVYVHDAVVDGAHELWSVPVAGGDPIRLSGLLPSPATILRFALTPDSQTAVYLAPQDSTGVYELYSAPIAGPEGSWIRLNQTLVTFGNVAEFVLAPDGSRVAYVADAQTDGIFDVWSVPVEGGTAIRLRPALTPAGSTAYWQELRVSADGSRVAFQANFSDLFEVDLWSARLDGTGGVQKLSGDLAEGSPVQPGFAFSPDGARVVFRAAGETPGKIELHSAPAAGGSAPIRLNGTLPAAGDVIDFAFSPDGSRVVYRADQQVDERFELYSVPVTGGTPVLLNGPLVAEGDIPFGAFAVSPDGARVVYRADQAADERFELYSVPLTGGAAVKLNSALDVGGDILDFAFTPDGSRVVYRGDQQTDGAFELYAVPVAGGAAVRVNDPLVPGGRVSSGYSISPDGGHVAYRADREFASRIELYRASIAGGDDDDVRMSGDLVTLGDVADFVLHPDGWRALYVADQEVSSRDDLYVGDPCLLCDAFESGDFRRWN